MKKELDFDRMQQLIDRMYAGDREAIVEGLNHPGCLFRINAIFSIYENDIHEEPFIKKLQLLKNDPAEIDRISVGDYSKAVLHLYGIEEYTGNKRYVWYLIRSKMDTVDESI